MSYLLLQPWWAHKDFLARITKARRVIIHTSRACSDTPCSVREWSREWEVMPSRNSLDNRPIPDQVQVWVTFLRRHLKTMVHQQRHLLARWSAPSAVPMSLTSLPYIQSTSFSDISSSLMQHQQQQQHLAAQLHPQLTVFLCRRWCILMEDPLDKIMH